MDRPPGVEVKFLRARKHFLELSGQIDAYIARVPFATPDEEDSDTGDLVTRVRIREEVPSEWSGIVGDVVHNGRVPLDHLACHIVERDGGDPIKAAFPTGRTEAAFRDAVKNCLRGASAKSKAEFRGLKVYPGGDDELWRLHQLDISDKHRLLIPVGAAHRSVNLETTFELDDGRRITSPTIAIRPEDRQFPLVNGLELFRVRAAARTQDQGLGFRFSQNIEIAFGEAGPEAGHALMPTLVGLLRHAQESADELMLRIDGAPAT